MSAADLNRRFRAKELDKPSYIKAMTESHGVLHDYAELLKGSNVAKVELADGEVFVVTRDLGLKLLAVRGDARLAPYEMLNFGDYEPGELAMLCSLVPEGGVVYDIGANVGVYAMTLARRVKGVRVHAFEPVPSTFALLERHLALNRATAVAPHAFGLSDKSGEVEFTISAHGSANASAADLGQGVMGRQRGLLKRLDDVASLLGQPPDVVKCDVEGGELLAFRGGLETLRRHRPVIFTEMLRKWSERFGYHPNDIIDLLGGLGYKCFTAEAGKLKPFARMDDATTETNFFFLHPEKHRS
ncbi:MAG: FkbM family methyltransferase [Elusimicrobia bacterium]|nr:FkbM family methyltransferase [Elusimicrobiota bacterium]